MEVVEILTVVGIIASLVLGLLSLWLGIKNRRNTFREIIYKDQYAYFMKLSKEFAYLGESLAQLIVTENDYTEEKEATVFNTLEKIYWLTEENEVISPDDVYGSITKAYSAGMELHKKVLNIGLHKKDVDNYREIIMDLDNHFRDFLGVDALSDENKKMVYYKPNRSK